MRKVPASFGGRRLPPGTVQVIKLLKSRLRPDDKSTNMTPRSKLQDVQVVHLDGVHTRNVSERLRDSLILIVDNKRSQFLNMASVSQFTLARPHAPAGIHLRHISPSLVPPEEFHSLLRLGETLSLVRHHKRHLNDTSTVGALNQN